MLRIVIKIKLMDRKIIIFLALAFFFYKNKLALEKGLTKLLQIITKWKIVHHKFLFMGLDRQAHIPIQKVQLLVS